MGSVTNTNSHCINLINLTLVLLVYQRVSDFTTDSFILLLTVSVPTLVLLVLQTVSDCYVPSHCTDCHCGPVCFTACEWFHARSSCFPSHFHSGPVDLTACKWFHARSSCVPFHCSHCHSCPVYLTGSELFYARCWSCFSHCPHCHSNLINSTESEQFHQAHLCPISPLLSPWPCWLNRMWVILCQSSCIPHCHTDLVGLSVCEWFHARPSYIHFYCPLFTAILLTW